MDERGIGQLVDVLVFALMLSVASSLLFSSNPIDPWSMEARYASSFAQSTLLALQHSTAGELGGFEYELFGLGTDVPVLGESLKRKLHHKTMVQLLVEDALLNMKVDAKGSDFHSPYLNRTMDEELRKFLGSTLDRLIGGRFGYRMVARSEPLVLDDVRVYFETKIEKLGTSKRKLCSERVMMTIPIARGGLKERIEAMLGISPSKFDIDVVVEITLELWST